ncbi:MAG: hypothetical protein SOZ62_06375 [Eubacteriales bacterium]|nr:hypothetical protein [Eubacteriales bacterium]
MNYLRLYKESLRLEKYARGKEFLNVIGDLLMKKEVADMMFLRHHMRVNRFQHLLSVSYLSYIKAKRRGLKYDDTARAAMLHDLFYYDYKDRDNYPRKHNKVHPMLALSNAQKVMALTDTEIDIISSHMWPLFGNKPKTKEGLIVCRMDKVCSVLECIYSVFSGSKRIRRRDGQINGGTTACKSDTYGCKNEYTEESKKNAGIEGDKNP